MIFLPHYNRNKHTVAKRGVISAKYTCNEEIHQPPCNSICPLPITPPSLPDMNSNQEGLKSKSHKAYILCIFCRSPFIQRDWGGIYFYTQNLYIQQILTIHWFCICEFIYLLKFICNHPNQYLKHVQSSEKVDSPEKQVPSWRPKRLCSTILYQLSYSKQVSPSWSIWCYISFLLSLLLVILLLKMVFK